MIKLSPQKVISCPLLEVIVYEIFQLLLVCCMQLLEGLPKWNKYFKKYASCNPIWFLQGKE